MWKQKRPDADKTAYSLAGDINTEWKRKKKENKQENNENAGSFPIPEPLKGSQDTVLRSAPAISALWFINTSQVYDSKNDLWCNR